MSEITVTGLLLTPVKGMRVRPVDAIELGPDGAAGNRNFYVVDEHGQLVNGKRLGILQSIVADLAPTGELALRFPDGREVCDRVAYGQELATRFFSRPRPARELAGPWSAALSEFAGEPLRLVESGSAVDRGRRAAVSLVSRESLRRLAEVAETDSVDGRRFRMLIEVAGVTPHEEDRWVGRTVRIGPARVAFGGHVGRCMVTTRNPDSGEVDLKTLHALNAYRGDEPSAEPLPFGIYGEVLAGGRVRVGDPVTIDGAVEAADG